LAGLVGGVPGETWLPGDEKIVFVSEIEAVEAVDYWANWAMVTFSGWRFEDVRVMPLKRRRRARGSSCSKIAGSCFAAGLVPLAPFIDYELNGVVGICFARSLQ